MSDERYRLIGLIDFCAGVHLLWMTMFFWDEFATGSRIAGYTGAVTALFAGIILLSAKDRNQIFKIEVGIFVFGISVFCLTLFVLQTVPYLIFAFF